MFSDAQWFFLNETDSTNNVIQQKLAQGHLPEGSVVVADYQSQGKGQRGSVWQSKPGENLLFSMVLYPTFLKPDSLFRLSKALALAAADFASNHCNGVQIKWPNDIYIDGKKTGGILLENTFRGSDIHASVAGLGINLNQDHFDELQSTATSLKIASGKQMDVRECAAELFTCLTHRYAQLRKGDFEILDHEYHSKLYRLNMKTQFKSNNQIFSGTIKGVNEQGLLMIDNGSEILNFEIKEVSFLNP
ncbi:MAG: biotin--[acetyl-CoA-carboxylase] ligase [Bacteroidetes bacterium]|nr:biotin--[acetyl-CoA-carboxylase] ligase [Bacteroidota bacterium]